MSKVLDYGHYKLACLPSLSQRLKQNTLYTSIENIAGESLADLDLLYVMATDGTRVFAGINWVDPGSFSFTEVNSPTFTENEGFTGNAANQYITTQWSPDPDGVNYTLDEGGAFCYVNNEISGGAKAAFGVRGNGGGGLLGQTLLFPDDTTNTHTFCLQSSGTTRGAAVASVGFYHMRRVADNDSRLFKDGSQVGTTVSTASNSLSTRDLYILAINANDVGAAFHSDAQIGMFGIGASLTGQESALYTAWNTYFSSL